MVSKKVLPKINQNMLAEQITGVKDTRASSELSIF
jgi:hypothetical protein